jgi:hypothetical protein
MKTRRTKVVMSGYRAVGNSEEPRIEKTGLPKLMQPGFLEHFLDLPGFMWVVCSFYDFLHIPFAA